MRSYTILEEAFQILEQRPLAPYGAPFERYTSEVWQFIDQRISNLAPQWYRQLTERYRVGGAYFNYPVDAKRKWIGQCEIPRPSRVLYYVYSGWPLPDLLAQGWFCFAEGEDGNLWMFDHKAIEDPEVYILELTSWNGGTATLDNGIISPKLMLSQLLQHGAHWKPEK